MLSPEPAFPALDAVVVGNITLDVICYPVEQVPRYDSIAFERSAVSPGGCGSNVAVGLAAQGIRTALVGCVGDDDAADLAFRVWKRVGLDTRFVRRLPEAPTGVSVGLVDRAYQPRFVHTPGANAHLTPDLLEPQRYADLGARWLHIAAYFVLPGLLTPDLAEPLAQARALGMSVSLDVVLAPAMRDPSPLWPLLPHLDLFMANEEEIRRITRMSDSLLAARLLRQRGARWVVVKRGAEGCWVEGPGLRQAFPAPRVRVVDTTGAGDAFAAGLIAARLHGSDWPGAFRHANQTGSHITTALGPISAWFGTDRPALRLTPEEEE